MDQINNTIKEWNITNVVEIPGRGLFGLVRFMFTTGVVHGINELGWEGRWCFENRSDAISSLNDFITNPELDNPDNEFWIKYKGAKEYSNYRHPNFNKQYDIKEF